MHFVHQEDYDRFARRLHLHSTIGSAPEFGKRLSHVQDTQTVFTQPLGDRDALLAQWAFPPRIRFEPLLPRCVRGIDDAHATDDWRCKQAKDKRRAIAKANKERKRKYAAGQSHRQKMSEEKLLHRQVPMTSCTSFRASQTW